MADNKLRSFLLTSLSDLRQKDVDSLVFILGLTNFHSEDSYQKLIHILTQKYGQDISGLLAYLNKNLKTIGRNDLARKIMSYNQQVQLGDNSNKENASCGNANLTVTQRDRSLSKEEKSTSTEDVTASDSTTTIDLPAVRSVNRQKQTATSMYVCAEETTNGDIEKSEYASKPHVAKEDSRGNQSSIKMKKDNKSHVEGELAGNFKKMKIDDSIPTGPHEHDENEDENKDSKQGLESEYTAEIVELGQTGNVPSDVISDDRFSQELHIEKANYSDDDIDYDDEDDEYEMKGNSYGKCIIFNNTFVQKVLMESDGKESERYLSYREGTDIDVIRLQKVFQWLKFTVKVYTDREMSEMQQILQREASNEENMNINCLVVCILSHGKEGGIFAADGRFLKLQNILDIFVSSQCKALLGKPKLFFVQACQGEIDGKCIGFDDKEPTEDEEPASPDQRRRAKKKINVKADQFVFLSTTPGNVSWRSKLRGSWFIQTLCKVFEDLADKKSFHELVLKINYRIAKRAERLDDSSIASMMSSVGQNTLRKTIYFHPDQKFTTFKDFLESMQASS